MGKHIAKSSSLTWMVIIFIHNDFKEEETMMEIYALEHFVKVEQEGPSDFFFEAVGVGDDANTVSSNSTGNSS